MAVKKRGLEEASDPTTDGLNITALIDVCFLLTFFFIMSTEISRAEVIEVFLPQASCSIPDDSPPDDRLIVNVDHGGCVWINSVNWGRPNDPKNRERLTKELRWRSEAAGFESQPPAPSRMTVYIRSDANCAFRYVQCLTMILADPKVRVVKVHYVTRNKTPDGKA